MSCTFIRATSPDADTCNYYSTHQCCSRPVDLRMLRNVMNRPAGADDSSRYQAQRLEAVCPTLGALSLSIPRIARLILAYTCVASCRSTASSAFANDGSSQHSFGHPVGSPEPQGISRSGGGGRFTNANHLLNFQSYDSQRGSRGPASSTRGHGSDRPGGSHRHYQYRPPKYDKDKFLQANFRFLVSGKCNDSL